MRVVRLLAGALAVAALLSACSGAGAGSIDVAIPAAEVGLPSQVLGLRVTEEDIGDRLEAVRDTYFDAVTLFGFREQNVEETLRATLQVGRFNNLARPDDPAFLSRIVAQTGTSVPEEIRVGDHPVHMSGGEHQLAFLWFADEYMYAFTVRRDYPFNRTMLRRLVEGSLG